MKQFPVPARAAGADTERKPLSQPHEIDEIEYPFAELPQTGQTLEVAPGVAWLRMALPFALDHINLWLLDDGDELFIIDSGFGTLETQAVWEQLLAADGRRISGVLVTHFHPDHLGLASWLAARDGAPVFMTEAEYLTARAQWHQVEGHATADMLTLFRQHGLDEARLAALEARGNTYRRGVPQLPARHHRLLHGERLDIGGNSWEILVGHGHSPEHASLYCATLGVLISGDMLLPRISPNISISTASPLDDPLQHFLHSLQRSINLPDSSLVLPSHGKPFKGIHSRVQQLQAHHAERCSAIIAALDSPRSAAELLPLLFRRELDNHQMMFAMGEAIAHLNHLVHRDEAQRVEDGAGRIRFLRRR